MNLVLIQEKAFDLHIKLRDNRSFKAYTDYYICTLLHNKQLHFKTV